MSAVAATTQHAESPEAYASRLFEQHSRVLFGVCYRQLRRREDAEDAVQTTFVYALRSLRRGVVPQLELPWLLMIARNVCSTRRRNGMRRGEYETPQDLDSIQDRLAGPDRSDAATMDDFRAALQAIPESQRKALLLREWKGLSYDEIGSELGLSLAATETLLFRARRNAAQHLGARIGLKSLHGVPLLTYLRTLVRAETAKTLAVGAGAVLTIAGVPAAEPRLRHEPQHNLPPAAPVSVPTHTQASHRPMTKPKTSAAPKLTSQRPLVRHTRARTGTVPAPRVVHTPTLTPEPLQGTPPQRAATSPPPLAPAPVTQTTDTVTQRLETVELQTVSIPSIALPQVTVSTPIGTVTVQAPPLPPVHLP
jgi:RNA polymerase sigma-70 factor (ECF subfamily)